MDPFVLVPTAGRVPGVESRLLPKEYALLSRNGRFLENSLSSWLSPKNITTPTKAALGTIQSIYRITENGTDYWLNWLTDVDVIRCPCAGSNWIHWTGDNEPRSATRAMATAGPDYPSSWYLLGVWQPTAAPTVTPTGGTGAASDRAYVYTHATPDGWESAPSPASAVTTGKVDDTWAIANLQEPANVGTISNAVESSGVVTITVNTSYGFRVGELITISGVVGMTDLNGTFPINEVTNSTTIKVLLTTAQTYTSGGTWAREADHNVTLTRIYRTKDGGSTSDYFFVAEQSSSLTSYNDTIADADLGSIIETEEWLMPPVAMQGLREGPNQTLVAFNGNTLLYSEPGVPYAWPSQYQYGVPHQIVAIEVYDTTVFILTDEDVWLSVGSTPDNVSVDNTHVNFPCVSKRSVVAETEGIFYASAEGLALVGPNATGLITDRVMTKRQWENQFFPESIVGAFYEKQYFGFYTDSDGNVHGFSVQRGEPLTHVNDLDYTATAAYIERKSTSTEGARELYLVSEGQIEQWDANTGNRLPVDWESKVLISRMPVNPATMRVFADWNAFNENSDGDAQEAQRQADIAYNAALLPVVNPIEGDLNGVAINVQEVNGSILRDVGESFSTRFLTITLTGNDKVRKVKQIETKHQLEAFRLPDNYTATEFKIRIGGNVDLYRIEIAGGGEGLKLV